MQMTRSSLVLLIALSVQLAALNAQAVSPHDQRACNLMDVFADLRANPSQELSPEALLEVVRHTAYAAGQLWTSEIEQAHVTALRIQPIFKSGIVYRAVAEELGLRWHGTPRRVDAFFAAFPVQGTNQERIEFADAVVNRLIHLIDTGSSLNPNGTERFLREAEKYGMTPDEYGRFVLVWKNLSHTDPTAIRDAILVNLMDPDLEFKRSVRSYHTAWKRVFRFFTFSNPTELKLPTVFQRATANLAVGDPSAISDQELWRFIKESKSASRDHFLAGNVGSLSRPQIEAILGAQFETPLNNELTSALSRRLAYLKKYHDLLLRTEKLSQEISRLESGQKSAVPLDISAVRIGFSQINRITDNDLLLSALSRELKKIGSRTFDSDLVEFYKSYFESVDRFRDHFYLDEALKAGLVPIRTDVSGGAFLQIATLYLGQVNRININEYLMYAIRHLRKKSAHVAMTDAEHLSLKNEVRKQVGRITSNFYLSEAQKDLSQEWRSGLPKPMEARKDFEERYQDLKSALQSVQEELAALDAKDSAKPAIRVEAEADASRISEARLQEEAEAEVEEALDPKLKEDQW